MAIKFMGQLQTLFINIHCNNFRAGFSHCRSVTTMSTAHIQNTLTGKLYCLRYPIQGFSSTLLTLRSQRVVSLISQLPRTSRVPKPDSFWVLAASL